MTAFALFAIFFFSGISGLVYQVIWVREFGQVFGNTVYSASLVTGVFISCLGLGAYFAGRLSDKKLNLSPRVPLKYYARCEIGIALGAMALALFFSDLEKISALFSSYRIGENGYWELTFSSYFFRYLVATLSIAPLSFLMGCTLTFLVRTLVRTNLNHASWTIGMLYAFNTLGAASGAFLSDFLFIPNLGLFGAQLVAAGLNVFSALAAVSLLGRLPDNGDIVDSRLKHGSHSEGPWIYLIPLTACLAGLASMGMEVLWFRYLVGTLGNSRAVFSLLLTVILLAIFCGAIFGSVLSRKFKNHEQMVVLVLMAFSGGVLLTIYSASHESLAAPSFNLAMEGAPPFFRSFVGNVQYIKYITQVLGVPALMMGMLFPLLNGLVQHQNLEVGRRAGLIYLWNCLGGVLGTLLVGFYLLPEFGMQKVTLIMAMAGAIACLPIVTWAFVKAGSFKFSLIPVLVNGVPAISLMIGFYLWTRVPPGTLLYKSFPNQAALVDGPAIRVSEGILETIVVTQEKVSGYRILWTNGHVMSSTSMGSQRYMRAFSHIPLLQMESPESVLVICFGVGNTVHAASLHPTVKNIEIADLSKHVLGQAPLFAESNKNVLLDPRVRVFINDGRQHLRMGSDEKYDLVTLEPPPLSHAGVSSLYSTEFYKLARRRLKSGGFLSQWLPIRQLPADTVRELVRAFVDNFSNAVMVAGAFDQFILIGRKDAGNTIDPFELETRINSLPAVAKDLENVEMNGVTQIVGSFVANSATLEKATQGARPVSDNWPTMEYGKSTFNHWNTSDDFMDYQGLTAWCPTCVKDRKMLPMLTEAGHYMYVLNQIYKSDVFRNVRWSAETFDFSKLKMVLPPKMVAHGILRRPYIKRLFRHPGQ